MKAAQFSQYGDSDVIKINEVDIPKPNEGQVLVKVHASTVNPFDYKLRRGYMKDIIPLQFPVTIGNDFSGVVSEVGAGVSELKPGDEVYGSAIVLNGGSGAIAQYAAANAANISLKPKSLDHNEAAALVLVGISASQVLEENAKLQKGQKILIHGASGGIGSLTVQYAKELGAHVAATTSGETIDFVKELGADEVIDYETEKFDEKLSEYDVVLDTVGGDTYRKSFKVLKKGGVLVSMVEQPNENLAAEYDVKTIYQQSHTDSASLKHLAELADKGVFKVNVDKVFPLEQTSEAFNYAETGHPKGKVVISI